MPDKSEIIIHIELDKLVPFKDHPFAVREDEAMTQTVEIVKEYCATIDSEQATPSLSQAQRMKTLSREGGFNDDMDLNLQL